MRIHHLTSDGLGFFCDGIIIGAAVLARWSIIGDGLRSADRSYIKVF